MATQILDITGVRQMTGQVEGGQPYDYCKVYSIGMLDPTKKDRTGFAGVELKALPKFYEQYLGFSFTKSGVPFEVTIESIARGKGDSEQIIIDMKPVQSAETTKPPFDVKAK